MRAINKRPIKLLISLVASLILSACGGSADNGNTNINRPPLPPATPAPSTGTLTPLIDNQQIQIFGNLESTSGAAMGFALIPKNDLKIADILWQQISGPRLNFLAPSSQTIGFDVNVSGNFSLQVSIRMQGESMPSIYPLNFSTISKPDAISVRLDHTATELSKVSLHVGVPADKTIASVSWQQLAGPQAQNVTTSESPEGEYLFFDAPSVTRDAIIAYKASVVFEDGSTSTDDVIVTVVDTNYDTNGLFYSNQSVVSEDMFAYRAQSPYKKSLEKCVYNNNIPNPPTCTFLELPLIGMQTNSPTIEDILDRTLVSHQWMGERFSEYLQNSVTGPDMLNLFRSVTAIVISYDVRPSFYWAATGAIYLDAESFWQTPEERDTLNDQADYRAAFGSDLQFSTLWRYTKDNMYYPERIITKQDRSVRDAADVEAKVASLLYHELAHANDFFPSSSWNMMSYSTTPLVYFRNNGTNSDELGLIYPLRSSELHALAQVRYNGNPASSVQRSYRGTDIEQFFTPDIASSFYSYLTTREDFATLVERYMMLYRLDAEADIAIVDGQTSDGDRLVVWGQRNRITEFSLEDRTVFTLERVYPELGDIRADLRNLPRPILMTPNIGWLENLAISSESSYSSRSRQHNNIPVVKLSPVQMKYHLAEDSRSIH